MPCGSDRAVARHQLHEDEQWFLQSEIDQDHVGQMTVGFDLQSDRTRKAVVARHDLVAALAQPDDARYLQESRRELFHDGFAYDRTRYRFHAARQTGSASWWERVGQYL